MSTVVGVQDPHGGWERAATVPLNEAAWQAWIQKGRVRDRRRNGRTAKVVACVSILGLIAAAGLWTHLTPYEIIVRFVVGLGAAAAMIQAFRERHYVFAALFAALVVIYNPVFPVFSFSGDWQRVLLALSAVPFAASLALRDRRPAHA